MIKIQNIYYMLAYVFDIISKSSYSKLETEHFENAIDMYAKVLNIGISSLIKRGLGKEYIEEAFQNASVSGKLNLSESIKKNTLIKKEIIYTKDILSINSTMNQIIKTTVFKLLKDKNIQKQTKHDLKKLMVFYSDVDTINLHSVRWNTLKYNKNNFTYKLLINICYLIYNELIQKTKQGSNSLFNFNDNKSLHKLFEKFVLKYYQKHYKIYKPSSKQIDWNVFGDDDLLPKMQSDILLEDDKNTLIIDTKFYDKMLQNNSQFGTETQHSHNMYQIFTYVKNKQAKTSNTVSGLILYARTYTGALPDKDYFINNANFYIRSINLNEDFNQIEIQLKNIINIKFN